MVKNNRTNEEDLRQGLAEKARMTAEKVAKENVEQAEREDRIGIHDSREETNKG
jgi:hypothetical protein